MPGYGASAPAGELTYPLLADSAAALIGTLGETQRARRRPLAWAARSRCTWRCATPSACARSRCSTRARRSVSTAPTPRTGSAQRLGALDAGETPASIAEPVLRIDHGARRRATPPWPRRSPRCRASPTPAFRAAVECLPTHDVRARLGEIAAPDARARRRARRGDAPVVCRGDRRRHPRARAAGHPGRRPHHEPGDAGRRERGAARPPRRGGGRT